MGYHQPQRLDEALRLLSDTRATIFAGGTDLYPSLPGRDLPTPVLDISAIQDLSGISRTTEHLRIGALTRWSEISAAELPCAFDGLKQAALQIGGRQIQNAATLAGNLCNASPAADGVPPLLTLNASVDLVSERGTRCLPLAQFLLGPRRTARASDEILRAILVPHMDDTLCGAFAKLGARRYLVISIASVAALVRLGQDKHISEARIAVGACAPVPLRLPELEAALVGQRPDDVTIPAELLTELAPIDDIRGTAAYRIDTVAELCRRAIRSATGCHDE